MEQLNIDTSQEQFLLWFFSGKDELDLTQSQIGKPQNSLKPFKLRIKSICKLPGQGYTALNSMILDHKIISSAAAEQVMAFLNRILAQVKQESVADDQQANLLMILKEGIQYYLCVPLLQSNDKLMFLVEAISFIIDFILFQATRMDN